MFIPSLLAYWQAILYAATCCVAVEANSTLLAGGTIIAFNEGENALQVIRDGSLLVTGDRIAGIYESGKTPSDIPEHTVVNVTNKIITPGFIDTHRHGWQTSMKTLASNTTLWEYFGRFSEFASVGVFSAEDVYLSQLASVYEAVNAGVTTVLDHAHHTWSNETSNAGLRASIDSGARVFWAYAFHNVTNFTVPEQIANFRDIAQKSTFKDTPTSLGIAYDYFGSDPEEQVKDIVDLAMELNVSVVTTHTLQGPFGSKNTASKGLAILLTIPVSNSPIHLEQLGLLASSIPIVFSHASFLTYQELQLLRKTNQYISITPESEMHYGHTHPHSHLAMDQAALGVDTHFTFSADILTQARIWLQKVRYLIFTGPLELWRVPSNNPMSVNQAFLLATRNGGLALHRPDLGVITEGAKADLLVWDGTSPSMLGWNDPVAAVILHASVGDIEHVLVDGKFVKKDGKLTNTDYPAIRDRFLESAKRIQGVFLERARPIPEPGEHFGGEDVGGELMEVMLVDAVRGDGSGYGTEFLDGSKP
ncbi:unnamed protein product [Clonostachys rosea]|uniref:Amidohydrolase-related domain-containing protein n=1 Tax=Bionectria ochroleuca TaxID=29856 RepID=A0ABY6TX19_BIOOC|nr:unnamed protein product [Clonostachys rosea]